MKNIIHGASSSLIPSMNQIGTLVIIFKKISFNLIFIGQKFFFDQTLCMISRQEGTQRNTSIENYQKRFITKFVTNILILKIKFIDSFELGTTTWQICGDLNAFTCRIWLLKIENRFLHFCLPSFSSSKHLFHE